MHEHLKIHYDKLLPLVRGRGLTPITMWCHVVSTDLLRIEENPLYGTLHIRKCVLCGGEQSIMRFSDNSRSRGRDCKTTISAVMNFLAEEAENPSRLNSARWCLGTGTEHRCSICGRAMSPAPVDHPWQAFKSQVLPNYTLMYCVRNCSSLFEWVRNDFRMALEKLKLIEKQGAEWVRK